MHDEAPTAQDIDWPQIVELYRLLEAMAPGPTVTLNRAVAEAMVHGPRAGLDLLATVAVDNRVSGAQVRRCASPPSRDGRRALRGLLDLPARRPRTASIPERRYLLSRAEGLPRNGLDESRRP